MIRFLVILAILFVLTYDPKSGTLDTFINGPTKKPTEQPQCCSGTEYRANHPVQCEPPYFQGGEELKVKTFYDKKTGKLVGGQLVGLEDAAMRINVITLGIQHGIDAADLFDFENCYAPAICDTWDPLVLSADAARRRLKL